MKLDAARWWCAVLAGLWLAGCGKGDADKKRAEGAPPAPTETRTAAVVPAPALDEIMNASYRGLPGVPETVTLTNGRWEGGAPAGGASRPSMHLVRDFRLTGDLNGDLDDEAVVLLAQSSDGTGETIHVAVMDRTAAGVKMIGLATLDDRVQVQDARIEAGRLVLGVVAPGASDAMCCPGDLVTKVFTLAPEGLKESESTWKGRLSITALEGTSWKLRYWTWGEPAPAEPAVTLRFAGGGINGMSGCNRFFGAMADGTSPGDISLGPLGGTRMACPDSVIAVETKVMARMSGVRRFSFMATMLALNYRRDGVWNAMLFERTDAP